MAAVSSRSCRAGSASASRLHARSHRRRACCSTNRCRHSTRALREAMQVEIRLLQQRLGITTIMVTHDQREAMTMADEIVVMEKAGSSRSAGRSTSIAIRSTNSSPTSSASATSCRSRATATTPSCCPAGSVSRSARTGHAARDRRGAPADSSRGCLRAPRRAGVGAEYAGGHDHVRARRRRVDRSDDRLPRLHADGRDDAARDARLHVGMPVLAELPAHACKLIAARGA